MKTNIAPAIAIGGSGQKKKKKIRDTSKIICYSCNKKGKYASNYIKPKKQAAVLKFSMLVTARLEADASIETPKTLQ